MFGTWLNSIAPPIICRRFESYLPGPSKGKGILLNYKGCNNIQINIIFRETLTLPKHYFQCVHMCWGSFPLHSWIIMSCYYFYQKHFCSQKMHSKIISYSYVSVGFARNVSGESNGACGLLCSLLYDCVHFCVGRYGNIA